MEIFQKIVSRLARLARVLVPVCFPVVLLFLPEPGFAAFDASGSYGVGSNPRSVFAADLDGDGDGDLAVANYGSQTVSVLFNDGDGAFAAAVNYAVGTRPANIFVADVNGDGDQDVVAANFLSDNVSILLNNGDGTFAAAVNYVSGDGAWSVFVADLDGDGDKDLAVTNSNAATISILKNNGDGTFAAAVTYAVQSVPSSIYVVDVDDDDDLDLAVANYFGATISILKNNGDGTFASATHFEVGDWSTSAFRYPISLQAADIDGDGDGDLVTANYDSNDVSVLLNLGNGAFGSSTEYAVGSRPPSVFLIDLDFDGDRDVLTANYFGGTVSLLLNNGNGTFAPKVDYPAGGAAWSVFAADLDRDQDIDLAVANYDIAKVSILFSDLTVPIASPSTIPPLINLRKTAQPPLLPDGPGSVTYTYTVTNPGRSTITDIALTDSACENVVLVSGDVNGNTWLETSETWVFECMTTLTETTINFATVRGLGSGLEAKDVSIVEVFVGEAVTAPLIHLEMIPEPDLLPFGGGSVTYVYVVTNPGSEPLSDVAVAGDQCTAVTFVDGDENQNSLLEPSESWIYACTASVSETTVSTAVATGDANGRTAVDPAIAIVVVHSSFLSDTTGRYGYDQALAASPTINVDKGLVTRVGGISRPCESGTLIKLADDGSPSTQGETAVYYCGEDGKRYVFPDEGTYYSWYRDFSGVVEIEAARMGAIPIGGNVTYRPGAFLVKVPSDLKVYAVGRGGVLRWVASELAARTLYGEHWSTFVRDLDESFFANYIVGPAITLADAVPGAPIAPIAVVSPAPTTTSDCTTETRFTRFLSVGSTDVQVRALQYLLQCLGSFPSTVVPSGYFGPATESAVRAFQTERGIDPAGYVGPATREALNRYSTAE